MIYAVTGGRGFDDAAFLRFHLRLIHKAEPFTMLAHGNASGADKLAASWAALRNIGLWPFDAAWDDIDAPGALIKRRKDGKLYNALAGFWRNERMLDEAKPEALIRFPGGKGTAHCANEAFKRGIRVIECRLSGRI